CLWPKYRLGSHPSLEPGHETRPKMKGVIGILLLVLCPILAFSQKPPKAPVDMEAFMERLFPIQEEDLDYESIYEVLFQLYLNPIDINRADAEILQATYLLNPSQISQLINYRNR